MLAFQQSLRYKCSIKLDKTKLFDIILFCISKQKIMGLNVDVENINKPSLLRQIVDEVNMLDDIKKQRLLMYLRKDKILESVKRLDEMLLESNITMTDDEITEMISKERKAYHNSMRKVN